MDRLNQGHLNLATRAPETDMSRPGIECWEASTLAKSYSDSLLI